MATVRFLLLSMASYDSSVPGALPGMLCIEGTLRCCMTLVQRDQSKALLVRSVSALLVFTS